MRTRRGRREAVAFAGALALVLSVWNNLVVPRLPGHPASYPVANVAAAGVLLAAARRSGLSWRELGLARNHVAGGVRWGGACLALVAAGYLVALAVPAVRPLLADARVRGLDGDEVAYRVLVRIPLGTVLWEEVAFRAVLLAAFARVLPLRAAVVGSALIFGIWHVRPTLSAVMVNDLADGPLLGLAVLLGCLAMVGAGVVLAWLRLRSGSLLAPALLHLAANSLGTLAAVAALRLG